jgi:enediyne biosynthesis protein E4
VVNCVNAPPQLLRCDPVVTPGAAPRNWIKLRLVGTTSNRTGIGARIAVTAENQPGKPLRQIDELRSGGSYYSQNDLRLHFGLDTATKADLVEITWPSGTKDQLKNLQANNLYVIQEGGKVLKTMPMQPAKARG